MCESRTTICAPAACICCKTCFIALTSSTTRTPSSSGGGGWPGLNVTPRRPVIPTRTPARSLMIHGRAPCAKAKTSSGLSPSRTLALTHVNREAATRSRRTADELRLAEAERVRIEPGGVEGVDRVLAVRAHTFQGRTDVVAVAEE